MTLRHSPPIFLAAAIAACGTEPTTTTSPVAPPAVPAKLAFTQQPTTTTAGVAIASAVQVAVQDAAGNTVTGATAPVAMALGTNPSGGTLLGTLTVNAVAGVATFGDLVIQRAASGYTMVASSGNLTPATSASFAIAPAGRAALAIVVQPAVAAGTELVAPAMQVAVRDAFGNTASASTDPVTVVLAANPRGATVRGTLTVMPVQGIASFGDLRVDRPGTGYVLSASASGLTAVTSSPFDVTVTFDAMTVGGNFTCGRSTGAAAYCWGYNFDGALGDGTTVNRRSPILVAGARTFTAVAAGGGHVCALATFGVAYCWGSNFFGQLGDGSTVNRATPVPIVGSVTFAALSVGGSHSCGLTAAGVAYCWGNNFRGQLGDGTTTNRASPTLVTGGLSVNAIHAGYDHTCAVTAAGTAYCWGNNIMGQLGDSTRVDRSTPQPVAGGLTFTSVSAGDLHTCGLTTSGAAYCWGSNEGGQLGDGGVVVIRTSPGLVAGSLDFKAISTTALHTCGLTSAGASYCWGANEYGRIGDGTETYRLSPVAVSGGILFEAVGAGGRHTCGITGTSIIYCWGRNLEGQVGDGTTTNRLTPVRVVQ